MAISLMAFSMMTISLDIWHDDDQPKDIRHDDNQPIDIWHNDNQPIGIPHNGLP
jgi:hypothetical protein